MYLLDVQYNREDSQITSWIKNNDRCLPVSEIYYPEIYTTGDPELKFLISTLPGVVSAAFEYKKTHLSGAAVPLIKIKLKNTQMLYEIAGMLEERGCMLYNIDLDPARQYMLGKGIFPMANMEADDRYSLDYEIPDLKVMKLCVKPEKQHGIITMDEPIGSITLGETTIQGDESDIIRKLSQLVSKEDPDIITTNGGDSFDIPYLYRRAGSLGISFAPGRSVKLPTAAELRGIS